MSKLTHLNAQGEARMVDVSAKTPTTREALATARVSMSAEAFKALTDGNAKKGDVLGTARVAGILAAKRTAELIPLCHPLPLAKVAVEFEMKDDAVVILTTAKTRAETGVEMEALTAASVAALTIYDMLKAVDKGMIISEIRLLRKTGGKSGIYAAPSLSPATPVRRVGRKR